MALETYRTKRDFTATPEPQGGQRKRKAGAAFVIQKHAARRLHYDLRLEVDGVLRSWAVTRGPSLVPGEKRLAVHVEDHPLEYGDFEGTIPKGQYGAGTVIVWDNGTWAPIGDAGKDFAKGHLEFTLQGQKLQGRWHLVRMAGKPREKRENWLLIKGEDAHARKPDEPDILEEAPQSVKTGRGIEEVATGAAAPAKPARKRRATAAAEPERPSEDGAAALHPKIRGARKAPSPGFVPPALATLKPAAPLGDVWLHEIKFDGYRLQTHVQGGSARLVTRSGLDWTERFGEAIPAALGALPAQEAILDGEIVVETGHGGSDFAALQNDLSEGRTDRFVYYLFDLLYLDGYDLREARLTDRKALLERLLGAAEGPLRFSAHFDEEGEMILRHACRLSLEGIVSKRRDGKYRSGRGQGWIKSKCQQREEFVVAGFLPSSVSPDAVGGLILAQYEGDTLKATGRAGTGFTAKTARELYRRLAPLRRNGAPFAGKPSAEDRRKAVFVEPEVVVEVEFRNWTADGALRHPVFRGIREDKPAAEVQRESAPAPSSRPAAPMKLTHPDRLYWPEAGVTKEGLAEYYAEIWPQIAPYVVGRPLSLLRCPEGVTKACFFQKHAWKGQSRAIQTLRDPLDKTGEHLLAIDGLDGLIGLVQGAVLEIHTWQASLTELEKPDQIVMDLDPGEEVTWTQVIEAAHAVRARLEAAGLAGFVKTSGGKGLHVVAPLAPRAGWAEVKGFAKAVAEEMAADEPDRFVATITKSKRRGRILVDYLRNGRGATAVAAFSTRARDGAPVSMPLGWDELDPNVGSAYFTVQNAAVRLAALSADPWTDFRAAARPLAPARPARRRA